MQIVYIGDSLPVMSNPVSCFHLLKILPRVHNVKMNGYIYKILLQTFIDLGSDAAKCSIWSGPTLFARACLLE